MGNIGTVNPAWKAIPYFSAVPGITLIAVLSACGGSGSAPSSTAVPSVNLSASNGISPAQACTAAEDAWSTFNSGYAAAASDQSKAQVVTQAGETFAAIAFALSTNALLASSTTAVTDGTLEKDATAVSNDVDPIAADLTSGNAKAAAALIPGQFTADYNDLKAAACGSGS